MTLVGHFNACPGVLSKLDRDESVNGLKPIIPKFLTQSHAPDVVRRGADCSASALYFFSTTTGRSFSRLANASLVIKLPKFDPNSDIVDS